MSFEMGDTILGRYVIVERLGSGAMGVVYRAQDATLERDVALKVLLPHIGQDPDLLQRFRREARVLAKIRNPSIITVHDLVTLDDQRLVLVLEYVPGGSLDGYIAAHGPLDWRHTAQIGVAAAEALAEAHEAGVVHRDIKPSNILMEPDGGIRVADFGIARISGESSMTMQGESIGTPAFMSPEQALGEETGPASDIYSLGAVLFTATTGQVPFVTEEGGFAAALAHVNRPVPDPRDVRPDIPAPAADIIMRALQKAPADRFATALDMAQALRQSANLAADDILTPVIVTPPAPTPGLQTDPGEAAPAVALTGDAGMTHMAAPPPVAADPPPAPLAPAPPAPAPPAGSSSSLRLVLIAGGIAAGILIVLGLFALLMMSMGASSESAAPTQSASLPSAATSPPATSAAPATSSPASPVSPLASEAGPGAGAVDYSIDFANPGSAPVPWDVSTAGTSFALEGGVLVGTVSAADSVSFSLAPTPEVADSQIVAIGGIVGDPRQADFGIVCRVADSRNLYTLGIDAAGTATIWRAVDGQWTRLAEQANAVMPGTKQRLTAVCAGDQLSLSVDTGTLVRARDSSLPSGGAGVYVGSGAGTSSARAAFDSFQQSSGLG